jgi:hypothetical protein
MADVKISGLPASTLPLAGTEVLPIVQGGQTRQVSVNNLTTGKAVSATQYTSTIATGTAPLVVSSTTEVANLRAANATSADTANQVKSNATTGVLQIAGPGTGTTRVMTTPNANFTAARTDAAQSFTGAQSFGNNVNLTDSTAAKINFATLSSATTNYIQTHSDGYSLMLYVDRGVSKPTYLMNFGGTHEWGFAGTSSVELDVTNKNLKINTGNLVIGTSGKGIDFSATPGTGTSELLADYEEGTWTPTLAFSGASVGITYGFQQGSYTKVGRLVTATCLFSLSSKGSSSGNAYIEGLPFATSSTYYAVGVIRISAITCSGPIAVNTTPATTDLLFTTTSLLGVISVMTETNFSDTSSVMMTISYIV